MAANAGIFVGWNRAYPGKEAHSIAKFGEYIGWLSTLQAENRIESFEPVLLDPHGGDLNGFVLIRGEAAKLDELTRTDAFRDWVAWGSFNVQGFGFLKAYLNESVGTEMGRFLKLAQT